MAQIYFAGEHSCTLDNKNRVNIPAGIRKMLGSEAENTLVFAPGFEDVNLYAYPLNEWNKLTDNFKKFKPFDKAARDFIRLFVGRSFPATMDGQGRIMLPDRILKIAQIESEMLILGSVSKLEIWNPRVYQEYLDTNKLGLADLAQKINFSDMLFDEE